MITITEASDLSLVHIILTRPEIWRWIADDGTPSPAVWRPPSGPGITWLIPRTPTGQPVGVFCGQKVRAGVIDVHSAILPGYRGAVAVAAVRAAIEWVRHRRMAHVLTTWVPEGNWAAMGLARATGWRLVGEVPASWVKDGVAVPSRLYSLEV